MRIQGHLILNKEVELWAKNAVQVTYPENVIHSSYQCSSPKSIVSRTLSACLSTVMDVCTDIEDVFWYIWGILVIFMCLNF